MHESKVLSGHHDIASAGVDWLTCTAPRRDDEKPLYHLALELIESEQAAGNDVHKFSLAGYRGYGSGGARYGVRDDSIILQLSGECARAHWRRAKEQAANVSRLDVQVTVAFEEAQPHIIKTLHSDALEHKSRNGRPSNRTLITSTMTGDTLFIGKRQSDVYLRAYDKGVEQKCAPAGLLLRYEAELKRERAARVAQSLCTSSDEPSSCAAIIHTAFARQGVRVAGKCEQWQWDSLSLARTEAQRKLLWLRTAVRPSIIFLLDAVGRDEVISALGLSLDATARAQQEGD